MTAIVVDVFERRSGVLEALERLGMDVEVKRLPVGDYRLQAGVLVERKSTFDLHLSVQRGRLWRQLHALRKASTSAYLLIEGESLDAPCLSREAVRGAYLAVLGLGIGVLRASDPEDSARWLRLLAIRRSRLALTRDRPVYAQRLQSPASLVRESILAAVPGVSVARARALLAEFGSVRSVVNADVDAWLSVPGIGPTIGEALRRALD